MVEHYPKFQKPITEMPSATWFRGFLKRNELKKLASTNMEKNRLEMGTTGNIKYWFEEIYSKIDLNKFDFRMIGNCDESMLTSKSRLICIVKRNSRFAIISEDENNEHITIMTTCTANGDYMPLLMIIPLKNLPKELDQLVKAGKIEVTCQESGWIDKVTFSNWSKSFVKWIVQRRKNFSLPENAPFLLFLDSHSSRESSETLEYLKQNHVVMMTYPSHCSHLLQPLDVSVFGPFKKYFKIWRRKFYISGITWNDDEVPSKKSIQRAQIILAAVNALHQAMVFTNISNGFQKTGLYPRDPTQCLSNQRIVEDSMVTMTNNKRSRLPTTGGIITSESVINHVKAKESETKKSKKSKNEKETKTQERAKSKKTKRIDEIEKVVAPHTNLNPVQLPLLSEQQFQLLVQIIQGGSVLNSQGSEQHKTQ